jgi:hypothetical protein
MVLKTISLKISSKALLEDLAARGQKTYGPIFFS